MPGIEDYNKLCPCSEGFEYWPKWNKFSKLSSMCCDIMGMKFTLSVCLFPWEFLSHATVTDLEDMYSVLGVTAN